MQARIGYKHAVLNQIKETVLALKPYFEDEAVSEIMVNAPNKVFVTRGGINVKVPAELNAGEITAAITLIAAYVAKEVGDKSGRLILSARLPGFRIEAILPPVAVNGPTLCIRRHASKVFSIEEYTTSGVISEAYARLLANAVAARENFLIVGGTGAGKTTFMNTALSLIPTDERLFVIEMVHELQITADNHVLVECDDEQGVSARMAVRTAMRYAPKRIIVGELRDKEAFDWLDAANTGHPGSAATIHANSASAALPRLERLAMRASELMPLEAVRETIGETVQWMFYIQNEGATRRVSQVSRLHGYDRAKQAYQIESF
jgi:pilus assembly protein CpaF